MACERVAESIGVGIGASTEDWIDGQEAGFGGVEGTRAEQDGASGGVGELAAAGVSAEGVGSGGVGGGGLPWVESSPGVVGDRSAGESAAAFGGGGGVALQVCVVPGVAGGL